jgi:hypothetical protein
MVVEDTFLIRGRGLVVSPALDADRYRGSVLLSVELVDAHGTSRHVRGRLEIEHLQLIGGGGKWQAVIVLDEGVGTVVAGSRLKARAVTPE